MGKVYVWFTKNIKELLKLNICQKWLLQTLGSPENDNTLIISEFDSYLTKSTFSFSQSIVW